VPSALAAEEAGRDPVTSIMVLGQGPLRLQRSGGVASAVRAASSSSRASVLLQRAAARWQNEASCSGRAAYVDELWRRVPCAIEEKDQRALRSILRSAVAALAAPRALAGAGEAAQPLDEAARLRLQRALQSRLRKLVLTCLSLLDLADPRSLPALLRIRALVDEYEARAGSPVDASALAGKQWARLDACAKSGVLPATLAMKEEHRWADERRVICCHGRQRRSCKICTPCEHGKLKQHCASCSGCPHGKLKYDCVVCTPCPHGKLKKNCKQCRPCPHGRVRGQCGQCRRNGKPAAKKAAG